MDTSCKLRANLTTGEFEAEGPADWVAEQFERFRSEAKPSRPVHKPEPPPGQLQPPVHAPSSSGVDQAIIDRAFTLDDEKGIVSLSVLPKSANRDAEAILLVLYGFQVLRNTVNVPVMKLTAALNKSGVSIDRIDRSLGLHADKITKSGKKAGGIYGLNNPGVVEAEKILRTLLA